MRNCYLMLSVLLVLVLSAAGCSSSSAKEGNDELVGGETDVVKADADKSTDQDTAGKDEITADADTTESDGTAGEADMPQSENDVPAQDTTEPSDSDATAINLDENPDVDMPQADLGKGIYFSAHTTNNKRGDIYRLNTASWAVENITNTPDKYEYSPAIPANRSALYYSSADYSDQHLGSIWKASLDGEGKITGTPAKIISSEQKTYDVYGDGSNAQSYTVGRWNPSVSADGSELVFTGTYETGDEDGDGYLILDIELFKAKTDGTNVAVFQPSGDGNPLFMKPMGAAYIKDTKRVIASFYGYGPNEVSSEIYFETADGQDMTAYTFYGSWTDGNVAQRGIGANPAADEILFFRRVPDASVVNGIYLMSNILNAPENTTYPGYKKPDEKLLMAFDETKLGTLFSPYAFSPDGKLIAASVIVENGINKEYRIIILDREGKHLRTYNTDNVYTEVDGLIWR